VWTIPLLVDGRRGRLRGELVRFPQPPLWPWLLLAAVFAAAVAAASFSRDRQRVASGAIGFGALAALAFVATASAFALDANASPGTWIFGADGLVFVALGLGILIRARGICTLVRPSGSGCSLSPSHSRRPRCSSIRSSSRTFRAGRRGLPLRRPSAPALPLPPSEAFPTSRR
jgi:hypothetical protein